jgi:hypothetical protein
MNICLETFVFRHLSHKHLSLENLSLEHLSLEHLSLEHLFLEHLSCEHLIHTLLNNFLKLIVIEVFLGRLFC